MALQEGDSLPYFELVDQDGELFKSSTLQDKPVVLYFYPKNFTPGCTKEACDFRDRYTDFKDYGAEIIGVSSDTATSHAKFAKRYNLPYAFLVDGEGTLRKKFGVKGSLLGLIPGRETFVFNSKGKLIMRYNNLKATQHTTKALEALKHEINER